MNDYVTFNSYLDYVKRVGRTCGCYTYNENESSKMTEAEQFKLTGLLMTEKPVSHGMNKFLREITPQFFLELSDLMVFGDDQDVLSDKVKRIAVDIYYEEIEELIKAPELADVS